MKITRSFQGTMIRCIKSFAFFEEGRQYYCIYDRGDYFYVWCDHTALGINEIKVSQNHKENFRIA